MCRRPIYEAFDSAPFLSGADAPPFDAKAKGSYRHAKLRAWNRLPGFGSAQRVLLMFMVRFAEMWILHLQ